MNRNVPAPSELSSVADASPCPQEVGPEMPSSCVVPSETDPTVPAIANDHAQDEDRATADTPQESYPPEIRPADQEDETAPAPSSALQEESRGEAPSGGRKRPLLMLFLLVLLLCAGAGLFGWNEVQTFLTRAPETPGRSIVVDIEPGMTLAQVSDTLEKMGVVTDSRRFQLLARWEDKGRSLQAGRFLLNTGWIPDKVLDMLASGRSMLYRLTLREGLPWWDVAALLEKEGFCKAEDFASVIRDPAFLDHWAIPFDSAEGFLFPETYLLPRPREMNREAARTVADRLVEMFWKQGDKLWPNGRPSPSELKRLVTLASIVEKETSVPEERARVAGVYANRLRIGMLLQADPTVIYGMGQTFSGRLLKKHLEDERNPYNTYQKAGLPPGPICSFGSAALQAAIQPEAHKFLYFVATGTGREHRFSKSLSEHNRAVQAYREAMRRKK